MRVALFAAAAALAAVAAARSDAVDWSAPAVSREVVARVNGGRSSWTAGASARFQGMTLRDAKRLCGVDRYSEAWHDVRAKLDKWDLAPMSPDAVPTAFDVRQQWPGCATEIWDQSDCGSCWAFGSTETLTDRFCITYNSSVLISAGDATACCMNGRGGCDMSDGCNGGFPQEVFTYAVKLGIVSGGTYNQSGTGETCFPYPLPPCSHHEQGPYPMCPSSEYATPKCPAHTCTDSLYPVPWSNDTHMAKKAYSVPQDVASIQTEIMTRGSVAATMDVYSDFLTYTSGVYVHTTGSYVGGHAIKILGWGMWTDGVTPYWLVANSWNQYWGDNGYFLIKRGVDECGIESDISAATV
jgi:cathepsin B